LDPLSGSGNATITATYTANTLTTPRVGTITISGTGVSSQSSRVTQSESVDIVTVFSEPKITIYPNPTKDHLYLKFDQNILTDISISIVDISGKDIFITNYKHIDLDNEKTLDLSFMKSGFYFLKIRNGKKNLVYKIIKE